MPKSPTNSARNVSEEQRVLKRNFISEIVERDLTARRVDEVVTRFPPEPNGYLHIGHVMAICIDFGIADDYRGKTMLRFDDTNPSNEDVEFVEAIKRDVSWLGYEWEEVRHASDYFERLYRHALELIGDGKAYVDSLSEERIRELRGTVTEPGSESPFRERPPGESAELFERMRRGEFAEGEHVLRAKIDMSSPNMKMRDPLLYRIRHAHHYRTGGDWHVYPMYDFAHPLSDAYEGVTHSLCTLEFVNNRELYDWVLENTVGEPRPHQYEFAGLVLEYTVLSKRRLIQLIKGGHVDGWDDPRMPTITALRRRGVTSGALRDLVNRVGVTRSDRRSDYALLEHSLRDDLNRKAPRVMAVQDPLKLVITTIGEDEVVEIDAPYWPQDVPGEGSRRLAFGRELFIERGDFSENPPKGWRRLTPGEEVRLRHGFVIRCDEVVRDSRGEIVELRCSHDPATLGSNPRDRKVKGTIHWVSAREALPAQFRLYDRLFRVPNPLAGEEHFTAHLNPESLIVKQGYVEPSVADDPDDTRYQFERLGYFWRDPVDSSQDSLVFNRIVTLKDSWAKSSANAGSASDKRKRGERELNGKRREKADDTGRKPTGSGTRAPDRPVDPAEGLEGEQKIRYRDYREEGGLDDDTAAILAASGELSGFYEEALRHHDAPQELAKWIVNELLGELKERDLAELPITPQAFAELVSLVDDGSVSARAAKDVLDRMLTSGGSPSRIVDDLGLRQLSDEGEISRIVERLIAQNPDKAAAYRAGKTGLSGFFVGQAMRETGGRANPQLVKEIVERQL